MNQLDKLTDALATFINESSSRATRLEVNQENLTNAVTTMTNTYQEISKSNVRLEEKIVSLEGKSLDKITLLEDSFNELRGSQEDLVERVINLEKHDEREIGKEQANKDNKDSKYKTYTIIFIAVTTVVTLCGFIWTTTHSATGAG